LLILVVDDLEEKHPAKLGKALGIKSHEDFKAELEQVEKRIK
jgi:hypothetical protein